MRMPAIKLAFVLPLMLAVMLASGAEARNYKTPDALLKSLYGDTIDPSPNDAPSPYSAYFSESLNERLEGHEGLDFDPVISGQDGVASNVEVTPAIVLGNSAEAEVTFENGDESVTLYYTLVREYGGWRVDDIANQQGEYPWSLGELLAE